MRHVRLRAFIVVALAAGCAATVAAQESETTREAVIEQAQAEKVKALHPYEPGKAERLISRIEARYTGSALRWHPFFENAYSGGGFTLGVGYAPHVSPYNSSTCAAATRSQGYKRAEAEFVAPRLFNRRGALSVLGGWREATQVGFYGLGTDTSKDDRTNYDFQQPYGSALLTLLPDAATVRCCAAASSCPAVVAAARRGQRRRRSRRVYTPADAARPRRRESPTSTPRARSASTGAPRPAMRGAAASTASRCTTTPTATTTFGFRRSTTK